MGLFMKKYFLIVFIILFSIPFTGLSQNKQAGTSASQERVVLVTVEKVSEGMTTPTMLKTGSAYFSEISEVAAESAGKVLKVYVNEGDAVEIGQPLASLDDSLLLYSVSSAEAATKQSKANLDKALRDFNRNKIWYTKNQFHAEISGLINRLYKCPECIYLIIIPAETVRNPKRENGNQITLKRSSSK